MFIPLLPTFPPFMFLTVPALPNVLRCLTNLGILYPACSYLVFVSSFHVTGIRLSSAVTVITVSPHNLWCSSFGTCAALSIALAFASSTMNATLHMSFAVESCVPWSQRLSHASNPSNEPMSRPFCFHPHYLA